MTDKERKKDKRTEQIQMLDNCAEGLLQSLGRLLLTFVGVAAFGALVYLLLDLEIRLLGWFVVLPDTSPFMKGLILAGLLFLILLAVFPFFEWVYGHVRRRSGTASNRLFERIAQWLDDWFRNLDWYLNRGWWRDPPRWRFLILPGHSLRPTMLAVLMTAFLALGPRLPPVDDGVVSYGLFLSAIVGILSVNQWWRPVRLQFIPHLLVLGVLSLVIFFWPGAAAQRVVDAGPYRHFLIPSFWIIGAAIPLAGLLGFMLFHKYAGRVAPTTEDSDSIVHSGDEGQANPEVTSAAQQPSPPAGKNNGCQDGPVWPLELPARKGALGIDWKRFGRSLLKAPFFHLIGIVWWPSLAIVFVADPETMGRAAFFLGVAAWVVYTLSETHEELDNFLGILKRALFMGGQLLVSIAVIALAAGRLLDNLYVKTLIEGEGLFGWMNNWLLLYYLASAYTLFWYFEYWINRFSAEGLFAMFETSGDAQMHNGPIRMPYLEGEVEKDGVLVVHEAARYALIGPKGSKGDEGCLKRILGRMKLVKESIKDECHIDVSSRKQGSDADSLAGREFKLVIVHRLRFYFTTIYLILAAFAGWGAYWLYTLPQRAELVAQLPESTNEGLFDLRNRLFSQDMRHQRPAILLAASGGGTRAAVYTYSVLSGLHDLGVLKDVILASGISGGSTAIAYFAMHRDELINAERGGKKPSIGTAECTAKGEKCKGWERFGAVMSAPFIQDVLKGLTEWRMAWGCTGNSDAPQEGMRLGVLLQESFDHRFALDGKTDTIFPDACTHPPPWSGPGSPITRLGDQKMVGLIFNTALAGTFDCPSKADCATLSEAERLALDKDLGYKTTAAGKGGRLVLTNLRVSRNSRDGTQGPFPDEADALSSAPGDFLTYKVVNDPAIPLVSAAALSANFPPVFPNAAVDVTDEAGNQSRYWVTDGGATDNRGILSLLYALEGAICEELRCVKTGAEQERVEDAGDSCTETGEQQPDTCEQLSNRSYPPIHIVLAEASATDPAYKQDRGISTAFGAAERFASQLLVDKLKLLRKLYAKLEGQGIYLHKLAMPLTLRSAGGIGTHWMLPQNVTLRQPAGLLDQCPKSHQNIGACWRESPTPVERFRRLTEPGVDIRGKEAKGLVEALHRFPWSKATVRDVCTPDVDESDPSRCRDIQEIWQRWICKDPQDTPHPKSWYCFVEGLENANGTNAEKTYAATGCEVPELVSCEDIREYSP